VLTPTPDVTFDYCQLDADYGLSCKSNNQTAWFYNRTSAACETFLFGGCLGNQNRFLSESICHSVCVLRAPPRPTASTPLQHHRRTTTVHQQVPVRSTKNFDMRSSPVGPTSPSVPLMSSQSTSASTCPMVDCAGKDCGVSGFATDFFGCTLCICEDPCEVSAFPRVVSAIPLGDHAK